MAAKEGQHPLLLGAFLGESCRGFELDIVQVGATIGSVGKASSWNAGDLGSIPGSGRSPGEGNGNPLQYSCLENSMEGGAW